MKDKQPRRDKSRAVLDAMMKFGHYGFRHYEIRDLDMHGVFVLTPDRTLTKLTRNEPVQLALKLQAGEQVKTHLFRAQVVKVERDGAELAFKDVDIDAYSALLHATLPPRARR